MKSVPAILLFLLATSVTANSYVQIHENPVSLIIWYRADSARQPDFAAYLESHAALRFNWWKKNGYFSDYRLLLPTTSTVQSWDAMAILTFKNRTDLQYWIEMEHKYPGGLDNEGLELGYPYRTYVCNQAYSGGEIPTAANTTYMVKPYGFEDEALYRSFCNAYVVPEFRLWQQDGALRNYWIFINQFAEGPDWEVLMVLEYNDPGERSRAKNYADSILRREPGWDLLNNIKSNARASDEERIVARPVLPN